jgi:hypothetical protein
VDDMVHNVMTVQRLLEERDKGEGINFLELVINPDDYGQTVENIFYASFLIKEGSAGIQVDEDGQIVIRMSAGTNSSFPADQTGNESDKQMEENGDVPKNQAVIELDMDTWRVSSCWALLVHKLISRKQYNYSTLRDRSSHIVIIRSKSVQAQAHGTVRKGRQRAVCIVV